MTVFWIEADDESGPNSIRSYIERNSIALLSNRLAPFDRSSGSWLGVKSPRSEIKRSGLWNLQHVDGEYEPAFLNELDERVRHTVARLCS